MKNLKLIVDNEHNPVPDSRSANAANDQFLPLVGLSLGSFLQAVSMDQQTCILEICRDGDRGSFYFIQGTLHDAACGSLSGQEAALELLSWEGVTFCIKKIADKSQVPRKISKSLISLLMDSTRQMDERKSPELDPDDVAEERGAGLEGAGGNAEAGISKEQSSASEEKAQADIGMALQQCVDRLVHEMPDSLFRSVIIDFDSGEVLAGQGVKLSALDYYAELNRMFGRVAKAHGSEPGRYFLLNLDESRTIVFLNIHSIRWAVDFDSRKMKLGVFLNIMAPKLTEWCESALQANE